MTQDPTPTPQALAPSPITAEDVRSHLTALAAALKAADERTLSEEQRSLRWALGYALDRGEFTRSWTLGGQTGGSYMSSSSEQQYSAVSGETPPEWDDVVKVLEELAPEFTFLAWQRLMRTAAATGTTKTDRDYYGNWTETRTERLTVDDVCSAIAQNKARLGASLPPVPTFPPPPAQKRSSKQKR